MTDTEAIDRDIDEVTSRHTAARCDCCAGRCSECRQPWPCLPIRLADHLHDLRGELAGHRGAEMTTPVPAAEVGDAFRGPDEALWALTGGGGRNPWIVIGDGSAIGWGWHSHAEAEAAGLTPLTPAEPALPEHGTPAALRWAADEVEALTAIRSLDSEAAVVAQEQRDWALAEEIAAEHFSVTDAVLAGIRAGRERGDQ